MIYAETHEPQTLTLRQRRARGFLVSRQVTVNVVAISGVPLPASYTLADIPFDYKGGWRAAQKVVYYG